MAVLTVDRLLPQRRNSGLGQQRVRLIAQTARNPSLPELGFAEPAPCIANVSIAALRTAGLWPL
jgi:hypothetical protein